MGYDLGYLFTLYIIWDKRDIYTVHVWCVFIRPRHESPSPHSNIQRSMPSSINLACQTHRRGQELFLGVNKIENIKMDMTPNRHTATCNLSWS